MRSPFLRSAPANTSKERSQEAVEPIPEEYGGYVNPYRGTELHGVDPTDSPAPVPGYEEGRPVVYEPEEKEQEPTPVRIVGNYSREIRMGYADKVTINENSPTQLLGFDDKRISVKIRNEHETDTVYVGFTDQVRDYVGGFPLDGNTEIDLVVQSEIWVWFPAGATDQISLSYLVQYSVEGSVG